MWVQVPTAQWINFVERSTGELKTYSAIQKVSNTADNLYRAYRFFIFGNHAQNKEVRHNTNHVRRYVV